MNRREAVSDASQRLAAAGIPAASAEAEWLLAEVLGCSRPGLWLESSRILTLEQEAQFQRWLARRSARVPLQHLTGRAVFLDWELWVTAAVLIPRPETEGLALRASELLQAGEASGVRRAPRILDFATGSGCLALALAARHPHAEVHALDISGAALEVARENARRLGLAGRITFHLGDGFGALPPTLAPGFDLIVANPPYIPTGDLAALEPEVRDHDPRLALDGGPDGLEFYRRLAIEGWAWLRPGGWLALEFGDGQAQSLRALMVGDAWQQVRTDRDLSERERLLFARRR